jgi:hypothetical protein
MEFMECEDTIKELLELLRVEYGSDPDPEPIPA